MDALSTDVLLESVDRRIGARLSSASATPIRYLGGAAHAVSATLHSLINHSRSPVDPRTSLFALPLAAVLLVTGCFAPGEAPNELRIVDEIDMEAQVVDVDQSSRELTIQAVDGSRVVLMAGSEVRHFDQISAGDTSSASYVVSLSARKLPADEPDTEATLGTTAACAEAGTKPVGGIGAGITMTVVVKSVDLDSNSVTFMGPDGMLQAIESEREEGQKFIAGLKPGDRIELIYTEASVLSID